MLLGLVVLVTAASVAFNLATSDANVPVGELWHGRFQDGTAYRQWGTSGQAVILVGGFLEPSFVWQGVGPLLARRGRVYALDLRGFGYSERRGPYTLAGWADQVQHFVAAKRLGHPIVVGHSLGAAVAVELARRGVASRAVLLDGDGVSIGGPPRFLRTALVHSPFFTSIFRIAVRWPWAVKRILASAYGPRHPPLAPQVPRWTEQFRARDARQGLQKLAANGIAGFTRAQLRALHVRSLVVWAADDTVDSVAEGRATARDLRTRFVVIPQAGHLSMLSAPAAVARAIG